MSDERTYELFDIDRNRLDEEWFNQPKLYAETSDKLADARRDLNQREAEFDLISSELDIQIRDDPSHFGIPKMSEGAIKNCIVAQDKYQKAQKKVRIAKHRVDVLAGYCKALDHRKKALENAVELFLADYFSTPRAKSSDSKERMKGKERRKAFKAIRKERDREEGDDDD